MSTKTKIIQLHKQNFKVKQKKNQGRKKESEKMAYIKWSQIWERKREAADREDEEDLAVGGRNGGLTSTCENVKMWYYAIMFFYVKCFMYSYTIGVLLCLCYVCVCFCLIKPQEMKC